MFRIEITRILKIIFWSVMAIVIIGGGLLFLSNFIFPLFSLFSPRTSAPEITYGEFPFRIEYELNGQVYIIEDIVIAEFAGFVFSSGSMARERRWTTSLASGREDLFFKGERERNIRFSHGSAQYYMGEGVTSITGRPHIFISGELGVVMSRRLEFEEAYDVLKEYGITLISWEISEPIVNNFGD